MSIGSVFSDYLRAHKDARALQAAAGTGIRHHIGHLSFDDIQTSLASHVQQSVALSQEVAARWGRRAELPAGELREIRARLGERLRTNHYYRTAVDLKLARVEKKYEGAEAVERTRALAQMQTILSGEHNGIHAGLAELERLQPESKSEKIFSGLLRFGNGLRCSAYRHPVAASVIVASLGVVLPLYIVYRNIQPGYRTAAN